MQRIFRFKLTGVAIALSIAMSVKVFFVDSVTLAAESAISLVREASNRVIHIHVILPQQAPILAHYTEHLGWLPNIGKDSRPKDRDSNAARVSETHRNRKDGQECLTMS